MHCWQIYWFTLSLSQVFLSKIRNGTYLGSFDYLSYFLSAQAIGEYEELMSSQSNLVQKLRDECRHVASQLEQVHSKYKWVKIYVSW